MELENFSKEKEGFFIPRLTIIGVGLIGGSLALALKDKKLVGEITGVGRTRKNLKLACQRGALDRYCQDPKEGSHGADMVVIATPPADIVPLGKTVYPVLRKGAIITDVGSVKEHIVSGLEKFLPPHIHFIGGHPIAGREHFGVEAARPDLFRGCRVVVTPTMRTDEGALKQVSQMWKELGAEVVRLSPPQHDLIFAATSHLPHLISYALVDTLRGMNKEGEGELLFFGGGALKDQTRVATSSPPLWRDIFLLNWDCLGKLLSLYRCSLKELEQMISRGDRGELLQFLDRCRKFIKDD